MKISCRSDAVNIVRSRLSIRMTNKQKKIINI